MAHGKVLGLGSKLEIQPARQAYYREMKQILKSVSCVSVDKYNDGACACQWALADIEAYFLSFVQADSQIERKKNDEDFLMSASSGGCYFFDDGMVEKWCQGLMIDSYMIGDSCQIFSRSAEG